MNDYQKPKKKGLIFFMGNILDRMRSFIWGVSYQKAASPNPKGEDVVQFRGRTTRPIDLIKWVGVILGAAGTFASLVAGPVAHFVYGVDPLLAVALTCTGLLFSKVLLGLGEQLESAEAVFWLLAAPAFNWTWEEMTGTED